MAKVSNFTIKCGFLHRIEYGETSLKLFQEILDCWKPSFNEDFMEYFVDVLYAYRHCLFRISSEMQIDLAQKCPMGFAYLVDMDETGEDEPLPYGYRVSEKALQVYWKKISKSPKDKDQRELYGILRKRIDKAPKNKRVLID